MESRVFLRICTLLALSGTVAFGQTTPQRKSPTSKFYVADVEGFAQVNTGEKIEELTKKSVFNAEGTVIETKPDSTHALVMSNGVGLSFAPSTKLMVRRFLQEPFQPNRADIDSEPSVSQTRTMLMSGSVGLCSGKLVAGSSMIYDTPHGSVSILSQNTQKAVIETTADSTTVTLFEGALTLGGDNVAGGESILPGQQAVVRTRGVNQPPEITIGAIPSESKGRLEDMVNSACQARQTVYFDVPEREPDPESGEGGMFPVTLREPDPGDVGPIISPARR